MTLIQANIKASSFTGNQISSNRVALLIQWVVEVFSYYL